MKMWAVKTEGAIDYDGAEKYLFGEVLLGNTLEEVTGNVVALAGQKIFVPINRRVTVRTNDNGIVELFTGNIDAIPFQHGVTEIRTQVTDYYEAGSNNYSVGYSGAPERYHNDASAFAFIRGAMRTGYTSDDSLVFVPTGLNTTTAFHVAHKPNTNQGSAIFNGKQPYELGLPLMISGSQLTDDITGSLRTDIEVSNRDREAFNLYHALQGSGANPNSDSDFDSYHQFTSANSSTSYMRGKYIMPDNWFQLGFTDEPRDIAYWDIGFGSAHNLSGEISPSTGTGLPMHMTDVYIFASNDPNFKDGSEILWGTMEFDSSRTAIAETKRNYNAIENYTVGPAAYMLREAGMKLSEKADGAAGSTDGLDLNNSETGPYLGRTLTCYKFCRNYFGPDKPFNNSVYYTNLYTEAENNLLINNYTGAKIGVQDDLILESEEIIDYAKFAGRGYKITPYMQNNIYGQDSILPSNITNWNQIGAGASYPDNTYEAHRPKKFQGAQCVGGGLNTLGGVEFGYTTRTFWTTLTPYLPGYNSAYYNNFADVTSRTIDPHKNWSNSYGQEPYSTSNWKLLPGTDEPEGLLEPLINSIENAISGLTIGETIEEVNLLDPEFQYYFFKITSTDQQNNYRCDSDGYSHDTWDIQEISFINEDGVEYPRVTESAEQSEPGFAYLRISGTTSEPIVISDLQLYGYGKGRGDPPLVRFPKNLKEDGNGVLVGANSASSNTLQQQFPNFEGDPTTLVYSNHIDNVYEFVDNAKVIVRNNQGFFRPGNDNSVADQGHPIYHPVRMFDNSDEKGWSTLGVTTTDDNYAQIEFTVPVAIKSGSMNFKPLQHKCQGVKVIVSNQPDFAESVVLSELQLGLNTDEVTGNLAAFTNDSIVPKEGSPLEVREYLFEDTSPLNVSNFFSGEKEAVPFYFNRKTILAGGTFPDDYDPNRPHEPIIKTNISYSSLNNSLELNYAGGFAYYRISGVLGNSKPINYNDPLSTPYEGSIAESTRSVFSDIKLFEVGGKSLPENPMTGGSEFSDEFSDPFSGDGLGYDDTQIYYNFNNPSTNYKGRVIAGSEWTPRGALRYIEENRDVYATYYYKRYADLNLLNTYRAWKAFNGTIDGGSDRALARFNTWASQGDIGDDWLQIEFVDTDVSPARPLPKQITGIQIRCKEEYLHTVGTTVVLASNDPTFETYTKWGEINWGNSIYSSTISTAYDDLIRTIKVGERTDIKRADDIHTIIPEVYEGGNPTRVIYNKNGFVKNDSILRHSIDDIPPLSWSDMYSYYEVLQNGFVVTTGNNSAYNPDADNYFFQGMNVLADSTGEGGIMFLELPDNDGVGGPGVQAGDTIKFTMKAVVDLGGVMARVYPDFPSTTFGGVTYPVGYPFSHAWELTQGDGTTEIYEERATAALVDSIDFIGQADIIHTSDNYTFHLLSDIDQNNLGNSLQYSVGSTTPRLLGGYKSNQVAIKASGSAKYLAIKINDTSTLPATGQYNPTYLYDQSVFNQFVTDFQNDPSTPIPSSYGRIQQRLVSEGGFYISNDRIASRISSETYTPLTTTGLADSVDLEFLDGGWFENFSTYSAPDFSDAQNLIDDILSSSFGSPRSVNESYPNNNVLITEKDYNRAWFAVGFTEPKAITGINFKLGKNFNAGAIEVYCSNKVNLNPESDGSNFNATGFNYKFEDVQKWGELYLAPEGTQIPAYGNEIQYNFATIEKIRDLRANDFGVNTEEIYYAEYFMPAFKRVTQMNEDESFGNTSNLVEQELLEGRPAQRRITTSYSTPTGQQKTSYSYLVLDISGMFSDVEISENYQLELKVGNKTLELNDDLIFSNVFKNVVKYEGKSESLKESICKERSDLFITWSNQNRLDSRGASLWAIQSNGTAYDFNTSLEAVSSGFIGSLLLPVYTGPDGDALVQNIDGTIPDTGNTTKVLVPHVSDSNPLSQFVHEESAAILNNAIAGNYDCFSGDADGNLYYVHLANPKAAILTGEAVGEKISVELKQREPNQFNYNQVSLNANLGNEIQAPLNSSTRNDIVIGKVLNGPTNYDVYGSPTARNSRGFLTGIAYNYTDVTGYGQSSIDLDYGIRARGFSSTTPFNYTSWNTRAPMPSDNDAVIHRIQRSDVDSVVVTMRINSLFIQKSSYRDPDSTTTEMDRNKVTTRIEIGFENFADYTPQIHDITFEGITKMPYPVESPEFTLPRYSEIMSSFPGQTIEQVAGKHKRYVYVSKLDYESNTIRMNNTIGVYAISEIIKESFSYPLSAAVRLQLDARNHALIPTRTYNTRLKKIRVPSNYYPLDDKGKDKRFIVDASNAGTLPIIYEGDWDGTFKTAWTDNPAWVLYDLMTNQTYGMGSRIDNTEDINIFKLYKIARYCDAVDDDGRFVGITDSKGGLEPRYSCNILIEDSNNAFQLINQIATIFHGKPFYNNGTIDFYLDKPQETSAVFSNNNVLDGMFNYETTARDSEFNTVYVNFQDRDKEYHVRQEIAEDEESIRDNGRIETQVDGKGITSQGQARRLARYMLYTNKLEKELVTFKAGTESLMINVGDVIDIKDELKEFDINGTRIHEVDPSNGTLTIGSFETGSILLGGRGGAYVTAPTGYQTLQDLYDKNKPTINQDSTITRHLFTMDELNLEFETGHTNKLPISSISSSENKNVVQFANVDNDLRNTLRLIPTGSMVHFDLSNRERHQYRVMNIKPAEGNLYEISATQYNSGKFDLIDDTDLKFQTNIETGFNIGIPEGAIDAVTEPASFTYTRINQADGRFTLEFTINAAADSNENFYRITVIYPNGIRTEKLAKKDGSQTKVLFRNLEAFGDYKVFVKSEK